jgi:hypothetical protein
MGIPSNTTIREYFKNWYNNSAIGRTAYSIIISKGWVFLTFGYCVDSKYGCFYFINYDTTTVNGVTKPKYPEMEYFALIDNGDWIFNDNMILV